MPRTSRQRPVERKIDAVLDRAILAVQGTRWELAFRNLIADARKINNPAWSKQLALLLRRWLDQEEAKRPKCPRCKQEIGCWFLSTCRECIEAEDRNGQTQQAQEGAE